MDKKTRIIFEGEPQPEKTEMDAAHEKAIATLSLDAIDITKPKFLEVYGAEAIERDLAYVKERETAFAKNRGVEERGAKRVSEIFEAIIHEEAEQNHWLGPDAHTIKTSRYDDIQNGVDIVVEFQNNEGGASHLALAVDVTFSHHVEDKIARIAERLEKGRMAKVKYFSSDFLHITGVLSNIPEVIVGVSREHVRELIPLWLQRKNKDLEKHITQFLILEEIKMQLQVFGFYARTLMRDAKPADKRKYEVIAERCGDALKIVNGVLAEKSELAKELGISLDKLREDATFKAIEDSVTGLFQTFSD